MKVGLVLEGGAMRGIYTAGVIDAFLDHKIKVDGIIGVSAGALFGVNYCSNQRGRGLRYNLNYLKDKRYIGVKHLIKTGNIFNVDFAYHEIPEKLDVFDNEEFKKSKTDFYITTTNIETGQPEYIKITDSYKEIDYFRATSAMPFVTKIVEVNGKKYLDGALTDSIPLDKCREMGYDKIIVVLTKPQGFRRKKSPKTFAKVKYKEYPKLVDAINNRYLMYNETIDKIKEAEDNKEIFVIRPSRKVKMGRIEKDPNKIQEMYDLGLNDTNELMKELKKYLEK